MVKRNNKPLWKQPADFWVGASIVAGVLVTLFQMLMPNHSCSLLIGWLTECPPPVEFIITGCVVFFFLTAYIAHYLGLGVASENIEQEAHANSNVLGWLLILFLFGVVVWLVIKRFIG
jgi:hypothetical protein